jgi:hypothetical protein
MRCGLFVCRARQALPNSPAQASMVACQPLPAATLPTTPMAGTSISATFTPAPFAGGRKRATAQRVLKRQAQLGFLY